MTFTCLLVPFHSVLCERKVRKLREWGQCAEEKGKEICEADGSDFRFLSLHLIQGGSRGPKLSLTPNPRLAGFGRSRRSMQQVLISDICVTSVRDDGPDEAVTCFFPFLPPSL